MGYYIFYSASEWNISPVYLDETVNNLQIAIKSNIDFTLWIWGEFGQLVNMASMRKWLKMYLS